jgi:hypothetical protein
MSELVAVAFRSRRLITWASVFIVAIAAWFAARSGEMSALLFVNWLLAGGVVHVLGQAGESFFFVTVAFTSALLFGAPIALRRVPSTAEQAILFNQSTCLWMLVYVVALFWFGDFAL